MNIRELMFLKAMSGSKALECLPKFFSATGGNGTDYTPTLTNSYGTTINTTSAADNEVEVTQVYDSEYAATSYRNGYVAILFEKMNEWIEAGKDLIFTADIDISANPAEIDSTQVLIGSSGKTVSVAGGKITAKWSGLSVLQKSYVELRCGGCSFTLSNCKLTAE